MIKPTNKQIAAFLLYEPFWNGGGMSFHAGEKCSDKKSEDILRITLKITAPFEKRLLKIMKHDPEDISKYLSDKGIRDDYGHDS